MRPLKLTVCAFKSYGKKEEIDFEKLGNNGIYLIAGKTGSGKTTIFDAISFALFGNPSNDINEASTLRSKYALETEETFVELTFSYKNEKYFIKRNPTYERKSKRGKAKTVSQHSKVELHLPNGKILTKKNEVNEKIKDILGVNQNQFRQICMIAQGDFAKFLFAKTSEKENIFRDIFKTANYGILENKIKEKYKNIENDNTFLTRQLENFKERVEYDEDCKLNFLPKDTKNMDFSNFLRELISLQSEKNEKLKNEIKNIEIEKKSVEKKLEEAKEIELKKEKLENLKKEEIKEKIKFENYEKNLKNHPDKELEIDKLNGEKEIIKKDLGKYSELKNLEFEKNDLQKLFFEKEKKKINLEQQLDFELKNLKILKDKKESLEDSSKNIFKFENEMNELKDKIDKLEDLKNLFKDYCEKKEKKKDCENKVEKLEKIETEIIDKIHQNNEFLNNKEKELTSFDTIEKNLANFSLEKNKILNDLKNLDNLKNLTEELDETRNEYNLKLVEYDKIQKDFEAQYKISKNLRKIYNNNQAGFLAKTLIENEPCPVCGSTNHPKPAYTSEIENITLEKVEMKEKTSEELFLKMKNLTTDCGGIAKKIEIKKLDLQKNLKDFFEMENIDEEKIKDWISNKFSSLNNELEQIKNLIENEEKRKVEKRKCQNEIEFLKKELENLNSAQKTNQNEKTAAISLKAETTANFKNVVFEIEKRTKENFEFENEKNKLLKEENILFEEKSKLEKLLENVKKNSLEFENLKKIIPSKEIEIENGKKDVIRLENEITLTKADLKNYEKNIEKIKSSLEFENENLATEKILELENKIFKIREKIKNEKKLFDESNNILIVIKNKIFELEKEIQKSESLNIEFLLQNFEKIKNEADLKNENFQKNNSKLLINQKILIEYEEKTDKLKEAQRKNTLIKTLLDTIQGNLNGKDKIKFETYIHAKYFEKILFRANKRFLTMSNGKYELKRSINSDGNSKIGLNLDILDHHNGTIREVTTLSGGESFLASLSLALGFSDEIQAMSGGIQLDTLFIDEGFGTLDNTTLEQAMTALKSLSTDNKLIGIISHVNELKEEIEKQIVITKDANGISHAKINIS